MGGGALAKFLCKHVGCLPAKNAVAPLTSSKSVCMRVWPRGARGVWGWGGRGGGGGGGGGEVLKDLETKCSRRGDSGNK